MIRRSFVPKNESIMLYIPHEYIGKELEITVFPKEEISDNELISDDEIADSGGKHDVAVPDCLPSNNNLNNKHTILNLYI